MKKMTKNTSPLKNKDDFGRYILNKVYSCKNAGQEKDMRMLGKASAMQEELYKTAVELWDKYLEAKNTTEIWDFVQTLQQLDADVVERKGGNELSKLEILSSCFYDSELLDIINLTLDLNKSKDTDLVKQSKENCLGIVPTKNSNIKDIISAILLEKSGYRISDDVVELIRQDIGAKIRPTTYGYNAKFNDLKQFFDEYCATRGDDAEKSTKILVKISSVAKEFLSMNIDKAILKSPQNNYEKLIQYECAMWQPNGFNIVLSDYLGKTEEEYKNKMLSSFNVVLTQLLIARNPEVSTMVSKLMKGEITAQEAYKTYKLNSKNELKNIAETTKVQNTVDEPIIKSVHKTAPQTIAAKKTTIVDVHKEITFYSFINGIIADIATPSSNIKSTTPSLTVKNKQVELNAQSLQDFFISQESYDMKKLARYNYQIITSSSSKEVFPFAQISLTKANGDRKTPAEIRSDVQILFGGLDMDLQADVLSYLGIVDKWKRHIEGEIVSKITKLTQGQRAELQQVCETNPRLNDFLNKVICAKERKAEKTIKYPNDKLIRTRYKIQSLYEDSRQSMAETRELKEKVKLLQQENKVARLALEQEITPLKADGLAYESEAKQLEQEARLLMEQAEQFMNQAREKQKIANDIYSNATTLKQQYKGLIKKRKEEIHEIKTQLEINKQSRKVSKDYREKLEKKVLPIWKQQVKEL